MVGVERRESQARRILHEAEHACALGRRAAHLGGGERGGPERSDDHGHEPVGCGRAPLVEHEVVPRTQALEREVLIVSLEEQSATELHERRARHLGGDAVDVHVGDSRAGRSNRGACRRSGTVGGASRSRPCPRPPGSCSWDSGGPRRPRSRRPHRRERSSAPDRVGRSAGGSARDPGVRRCGRRRTRGEHRSAARAHHAPVARPVARASRTRETSAGAGELEQALAVDVLVHVDRSFGVDGDVVAPASSRSAEARDLVAVEREDPKQRPGDVRKTVAVA